MLQAVDPTKNKMRFYEISVYRTAERPALFVVERRYGRIGTRGKKEHPDGFTTLNDATDDARGWITAKQKRGYKLTTTASFLGDRPEIIQHDGPKKTVIWDPDTGEVVDPAETAGARDPSPRQKIRQAVAERAESASW